MDLVLDELDPAAHELDFVPVEFDLVPVVKIRLLACISNKSAWVPLGVSVLQLVLKNCRLKWHEAL